MRVVAKRSLRRFWELHHQAEQPLKAWYQIAKAAQWSNSADVKRSFARASIISSERVVFDIHGNDYPLITAINYETKIMFVKFIGTHVEYDRVDAATVSQY